MASAIEQLAANINLGSLAKATELKKRLWFTLGALIIYRLGTYIPIPGIDPTVLADVFESQAGGILGMFNMFSGGALGRMTIFALNIMPYISASIIMQLMTTVSPHIAQLKKEGEAGRKKMNQYTRYGTVVLAALQGYGIAVGLEGFSRRLGRRGHRSGHVFPADHGGDPDRRDHLPDVAGRTDYGARRGQRHFADYSRRHRRRAAPRPRQHPGAGPHGRDLPGFHRLHRPHGGGRDRLYRVHRALPSAA